MKPFALNTEHDVLHDARHADDGCNLTQANTEGAPLLLLDGAELREHLFQTTPPRFCERCWPENVDDDPDALDQEPPRPEDWVA